MTTEEHHSPDGVLTLVVEDVGDGDTALGFAQSPWHVHAHMLVPEWGETPEVAVRAYVDAVLHGEAVIGIRRKDGVIVDAWITENPADDMDRVCAGETLEMRYWDGRTMAPIKVVRRSGFSVCPNCANRSFDLEPGEDINEEDAKIRCRKCGQVSSASKWHRVTLDHQIAKEACRHVSEAIKHVNQSGKLVEGRLPDATFRK